MNSINTEKNYSSNDDEEDEFEKESEKASLKKNRRNECNSYKKRKKIKIQMKILI